jgi:hypothetical protein
MDATCQKRIDPARSSVTTLGIYRFRIPHLVRIIVYRRLALRKRPPILRLPAARPTDINPERAEKSRAHVERNLHIQHAA